jgi:hypothetical protein
MKKFPQLCPHTGRFPIYCRCEKNCFCRGRVCARKTAEHVNKGDIKSIRRIKEGDKYACAVDGGFARRTATEGGLLIETDELSLLVTDRQLREVK